MSKHVQFMAAGVLAFLAALTVSPLARVHGDDPAGPGPVFKHGLELRVRHSGEVDFNDKTKKVGVQFFLDGTAPGNGVYIGEGGDLADVARNLVPPPAPPIP